MRPRRRYIITGRAIKGRHISGKRYEIVTEPL
jgi:hypothetical protein